MVAGPSERFRRRRADEGAFIALPHYERWRRPAYRAQRDCGVARIVASSAAATQRQAHSAWQAAARYAPLPIIAISLRQLPLFASRRKESATSRLLRTTSYSARGRRHGGIAPAQASSPWQRTACRACFCWRAAPSAHPAAEHARRRPGRNDLPAGCRRRCLDAGAHSPLLAAFHARTLCAGALSQTPAANARWRLPLAWKTTRATLGIVRRHKARYL